MNRNTWRVYIKLLADNGEYENDFIEITDDVEVDKMSAIESSLDNNDYDIGIYKFSSISLTLRNDHGKYSDVGQPNSIFQYKRSDTLVKITWEYTEEPAYCGFALADISYLSEEKTQFVGLLNDEALELEVGSQNVSFKVLGRESIFQKVIVPFGSISNGDTLNEVLFAVLNQPEITKLMNVDALKINVGNDQAIDSISSLQNKTVQQGLATLLLVANSVFYIDANDNIVIKGRTASVDLKKTFYGQASRQGSENIQALKKVRSGIARTFNFFTIEAGVTKLFAEDASSRAKYGTRAKAVTTDNFNTTPKCQNIVNALRSEFGQPKQEFDLYAPLDFEVEALMLLDRVNVDYPSVYIEGEDPLPICGAAECGAAVLPKALWDFTLTTEEEYKILGKKIDPKTSIAQFKLRAI